MPLWDKVRQELDRAGRAAQDAIDEGRLRLDAFRSRQLADKAAQALGYAVYRARQDGGELDADTFARLSATLAGHEAEATRLEAQLEATQARWRGKHDRPADAPPADETAAPASATAAGAPGTASAGASPGAAGTEPSAGTGPAEPWMPTI